MHNFTVIKLGSIRNLVLLILNENVWNTLEDNKNCRIYRARQIDIFIAKTTKLSCHFVENKFMPLKRIKIIVSDIVKENALNILFQVNIAHALFSFSKTIIMFSHLIYAHIGSNTPPISDAITCLIQIYSGIMAKIL